MATLQIAISDAQAFLNDVAKTLFTDAVLLGFVPAAHRKLQVLLDLSGVPVIRDKSAVVSIVANAVSMGASLPTNLIEPISMQEQPHSSNPVAWVPMTEVAFIPDIVKGTILRYWSWENEIINFLGATTGNDVLLRYRGGITVPATVGAAIGFIFGENYLGPKVASLAAGSLGNTTAMQILDGIAMSNLDEVIRMNISGQQSLGVKRIPFRRGQRSTSRY